MMTDVLDETGLSVDSFEDRLVRVTAKLREAIDELFELTPDTAEGQIMRILLDSQQRTADLQQEIYATIDPDQATGTGLDAVSSMTGTLRKPKTRGTVTLSCNLDGGTPLTGGVTQAWSDGNPETTVTLDEDFTAPAGPADDYDLEFTFEEYGEITAPAGTIDTRKTSELGWNSVTNAADAIPGDEREVDSDLRVRRRTEVAGGGSTNAKAIRATLSEIVGVDQVIVMENKLNISQDGMPPHSIEAVLKAPSVSDDDLADAIYEAKAGGIEAWGTTRVDYVDAAGNTIQIGFTRALDVVVELEYTLVTGIGYPGDAAFKLAIASWADANLGIGDDVLYSQLLSLPFCLGISGVLNVTNFRLRFFGDSWDHLDLSIGTREIAFIDTTGITVIIP
jgi:uncharacterized phage protein gp47/JayE